MRSTGVGNVAAIMTFLRAAMTRRVDVVGIFDSNGAQATITGHPEGQAMALATIFGAYGTAFVPGNAAAPYASGIAGHTAGATSGASVDANFTAIKFPAVSVVDGSTVPWSNFDWQNTMTDAASGYFTIEHRFPLDLYGKIEYCPVFWRPQTGGMTKWRPGIQDYHAAGTASFYQLYNAPSDLAMSAVPSDGISEERWTINRGVVFDLTNTTNPAGTINYQGIGLQFRPHRYNAAEGAMDGTNTCGILGHRVCDAEKFHGIAYSTVYVFGGKPTRAASFDFCGISGSGGVTDAALAAYLKGLTRAQRDANGNQLPPMVLFQIIEGGNDAGDTGTLGALAANKSLLTTDGTYRSATEQANAGNTATGYYNNTVTIIRRIRYVWENVLGYSGGNLFFLIGCYHPQSPNISAAQFSFVRTIMPTGMASIAASERNVCYVDGYQLGSYAEWGIVNGAKTAGTGVDGTDFITAGAPSISSTTSPFTAVAHMPWARSPNNEDAHMNQAGYINWGIRTWGAIMDAARNTGALITPRPRPGRVRAR